MSIRKNPDNSYSIYDRANGTWVTVSRKSIHSDYPKQNAVDANNSRPRYKHLRKPPKP